MTNQHDHSAGQPHSFATNDDLTKLLYRVRNDFRFHPATAETGPKHERVREACHRLALDLIELAPPSRELSLALTSLEEAMMWANAAIARNV